jgi:hypothetical protein
MIKVHRGDGLALAELPPRRTVADAARCAAILRVSHGFAEARGRVVYAGLGPLAGEPDGAWIARAEAGIAEALFMGGLEGAIAASGAPAGHVLAGRVPGREG